MKRIAKPNKLRISIHALRVEGDSKSARRWFTTLIFLSTPSGWRATFRGRSHQAAIRISIHALRVEGDIISSICLPLLAISIHALRVEGDAREQDKGGARRISIHALRVEGDFLHGRFLGGFGDFYPRPPGGGRLQRAVFIRSHARISIHALRVEGDISVNPFWVKR